DRAPPAGPTAAAATTAAAASSSAASPHYQEWILDTIDSLRSRKARPDLERICRMVRRRHGPEPERTRAELEKLIQQRAVLRVSYKGSISYRNAARVQPPRRGATPPAPPRRVQGLLEEEAAARGRLERTRLGALALPRGDRPGRSPPTARASRSKRGGEERVLEKEEEEEDDEDDEDDVSEGSEVPESDRPAGAQHHQLNGERSSQSTKERVKEWSPCGPHQGQDEGRGPAPGSGTRQVFSMTALNKEGGSVSSAFPLPACVAAAPDSPSPVPLPPGKPKPTDPVEWTVMDVVEYFTEAGFPEQATAFQEQEIDGKSLLLMQRTDVLTGLSIRLGPALKIYEHHIKVLQQGHFEDDDPDGFLG
uniref:Sterile alpha motif domain containing 1 n=1 Tax=Nannospalax galili TaxID=1026970 RepID=A0A8C6R799_NANGA